MADELKWAKEFLRNAAPRLLLARETRRPVVILTDASLEGEMDDKAAIGATFIQEAACEYFSHAINQDNLQSLQVETTKIISTLELLAVVAAARHWKEATQHRRVFFFVDNEAARGALIKMGSPVNDMRILLEKLSSEWLKKPCFHGSPGLPARAT